MQYAAGRALAPAQEIDPGISGVRLEIARRGQQPERPARGVAFFVGIELPIGHRRVALHSQLLGIEFELARGGAEFLPTRGCDVDRPAVKHLGQIEPRNRPGSAAPQFSDRCLGIHAEHRIGETHSPGQFLRQPEIRAGLALRRHGRRRVLQPIGPIGPVNILGFEIGRRRQDDVGVTSGDRHERVVHHREQIFAREALTHLVGLGAGHRRVVGGDEQRPDRRIVQVQQCVAQPQMVDRSRGRWAGRFADRVVIPAIGRNGQQKRSAAAPSIGAGHTGQQCHRA